MTSELTPDYLASLFGIVTLDGGLSWSLDPDSEPQIDLLDQLVSSPTPILSLCLPANSRQRFDYFQRDALQEGDINKKRIFTVCIYFFRSRSSS